MKSFYKVSLVLMVAMLVFLTGCSDKEKAIGTAVANGDIAKVQSLLDKGVSPNAKTADGKSLLMLAAYLGHTDIAKLLIDRGAAVNAKDQDGKTALMYAAEKGNVAVAKLLLEHGADLNAVANNGKTALQIARDNNQTAMVDFLSSWGKAPVTAVPEPAVTPVPTPAPVNAVTPEPTPVTVATPAETPTPSPTAPAPAPVTSLNKDLNSIFFDFDKAELRPDQTKVLAENLAVLKANPNLYIILGAHADERGSRDYNIELSARRAEMVKAYLTKAGIAEDHFVVYAFGKDHPLTKETDEAAMSRNRRVDILMWETQLSGEQVLQETIK